MKKLTRHKLVPFSTILLLLLWSHFSGGTAAAQEEITAELTPAQTDLTVGDVVPLTLSVTHPPGYRLIPLQPDEAWGDFEVRSVSLVEVVDNGDGTETSSQTLNVTLWAPGSYTTPDLPLSLADTGGNVIEIQVSPTTLTVHSVLLEGDTELRDIKPQATEPIPPIWPWVAGGLALLLLGLYGLWWLVRRWRAGRRLPAAVANLRPAYQIALDELSRIEQLQLPDQQRFKEHYTLVSDVLRGYLEREYAVTASDQTTAEIRLALKPLSLPTEQKTNLINLLGEADLVKFAKVKPDVIVAVQYPTLARQFVLATRPSPAISPSANGQSAPTMEANV